MCKLVDGITNFFYQEDFKSSAKEKKRKCSMLMKVLSLEGIKFFI